MPSPKIDHLCSDCVWCSLNTHINLYECRKQPPSLDGCHAPTYKVAWVHPIVEPSDTACALFE